MQTPGGKGVLPNFLDPVASPSVKTINLLSGTKELTKYALVRVGETEYPFEFTLEPGLNRQLYETYHGMYLAIQYQIKTTMKRAFPLKSLVKIQEFNVNYTKSQQNDASDRAEKRSLSFTITPESIERKERSTNVPRFSVTGKLDSCSILVAGAITGELTVVKSDAAIRSIEVQLLRTETCGSTMTDGAKPVTSELQTTQIADGDVQRGVAIPIYLLLPRLFTCATTEAVNFRIEFQLAIALIFKNDQMIKNVFPLTLHRW